MYILSFGEIDVHSTLWVDFAVICYKSNEYPVKTPTMAPGVFKLALHDLNFLNKQRELLPGANRPHCSIQSSEVRVQLLQRRVLGILRNKTRCGPKLIGSKRLWRWLAVRFPFSRRLIFQRSLHVMKDEPQMTWKRKRVNIKRRYCLNFGVVSTIIRLFSVEILKWVEMTSIRHCMTAWDLF